MDPLYVAPPGGMRRFNTILGVLLVASIAAAIGLLAFVSTAGGLVLLIAMLATFGVIWLILPMRYEIWPDRLRLVFPAWKWDVPYDSVQSIRAGRWHEAYGFAGLRFATAPSQTVTILRHNANLFSHPNLVISPADREEFLRHLEHAMTKEDHQRMGSG